jgi:hypothetical protein
MLGKKRKRDTKSDDLPPLEVESFIWKKNAFRGDLTLHLGLSNHCSVKGNRVFHLFIDCDSVDLRTIFDGIELLRKRFPELAREKFLISSTSPSHFSIASFPRLTWKRYLEILWYAVEIGIEHEGHAAYSTGKGYAVLRAGGKDGLVPRIMFQTGDTVSCKVCMDMVIETIKENQ